MLDSTLVIAIRSGTAIMFAVLGAILTEKSGVINLAIEGVLKLSAMVAVAAALATDSALIGILAAALAGSILMLVHAFGCVTLRMNQVATGLAITILGSGLAELLGEGVVGKVPQTLERTTLPVLGSLPVIGAWFRDQDLMTMLLPLVMLLVWWLVFKTRIGINLRAVGENPQAAAALGVKVMRTRYLFCLGGGCLIGLGGAHLSLAFTPGWSNNITAGRGWIAVAIVIFSFWHPVGAVAGMLLFGGVLALKFRFQAMGVKLPVYFLDMLPYLATVSALTLMSWKRSWSRWAPKALGQPYYRE